MKCPNDHELPNVVNGLNCSPRYCAVTKQRFYNEPPKKPKNPKTYKPKQPPINHQAAAAAQKELTVALESDASLLDGVALPEEAKATAIEIASQAKAAEVGALAKAVGRFEGRRSLMKTPKGLDAEEGKAYVEKRLDQMLPDAVDRVAYELVAGDAKGSLEAAYEILDRKGFGKKEGAPTLGAPIIVQINNGPGVEGATYKPAWLQTVNNKGEK